MKLTSYALKKLGFADLNPINIDIDDIRPDILDKISPETRLELKNEFQNLNLSNDFLFCYGLSDAKICKMLLEEILNISIGKVVYNERQNFKL
ncbi:MAG: hypothetical protein LUC97_03485 [Clostridiales bacterium]|nr:hypothetical protein [Clostridiales bacterium]